MGIVVQGNPSLREDLELITKTSGVDEHPDRIEGIRERYRHTISLSEGPASIDRYTCAVYAFDLVEVPKYVEIATYGLGRTYAGPDFVDFVLANGFLAERELARAAAGDLLIYLEGGAFRHVGKSRSPSRAISKWGVGQLWEHALWEVPSGYGNEVRCYEALRDGLDLFLRFARSKGFRT